MKLNRRDIIAGLGATGALAACSTTAAPSAGAMPRVAGLAPAAPQSVGFAAALPASINAMMQGHVDAGRITGGVTAVARRNKLVHFAAHGMFDREAGTPMRTDALFRMMSSTKPVTGVALLQQREQGKLSLDDGISKYIPELRTMSVWKPEAQAARRAGGIAAMRAPARPEEVVPANREITLKDLATHTSGLNGTAGQSAGDTLASYIPRLRTTPLDFQPGTRWAYSATTGPDVLARVIEITSGLPYNEYLSRNIFGPLGMVDTAHNLTDAQIARRTPRYAKPRAARNLAGEGGGAAPAANEGAWTLAEAPNSPRASTYYAGAYGLSSTAADYLRFESMLLNKGTFNGHQVLKPESVELMHTNLVGDLYKGIGGTTQGTDFGVLVRIVRDAATCGCNRAVGAFGWGGAYGTMSWTDPQRELVAVIMIQQSVDQVQRDFERVIREQMA
jgi:CubicO group peptidase (beta-lactamase class C family)